MTSPARFLIDSDVLITAKNRYYAFAICPGFWESLLHAYDCELLSSIDRVKNELLNGSPDDDLVKWVHDTVPARFFERSSGEDVIDAFKEVMLWVKLHSQFTEAAKANFASGADGWLVAHGIAYGHIIVTNEQPEPYSKKKIKIPDLCNAFSVSFQDSFEMLRNIGIQFHFLPQH